MSDDLEHMRQWIGRTEERDDVVTARLADAYRATVFDAASRSAAGDAVDAGLHWCLTTPDAPMSGLGPDGHPLKGGFLPPIPAPRRMWAGSKVEFLDALRVGDAVRRVSTVAAIDRKSGRSGPLWFVSVDHEYATGRGPAVRERQDIVYRDEGSGQAAEQPAAEPVESAFDASLTVPATPALLFRYSALTFNTHRIHYDLDYATNVERYPGLVVHGPLQAALLLRLAGDMQAGQAPRRFSFRGMKALTAGGDIACRGAWTGDGGAELWTGASREAPSMQARAFW